MNAEAGPPGAIFSMLQRAFGDAVMSDLFSERNTVEAWLRTEAALAQSQAAVGDLPAAAATAITAACLVERLDLERLWSETANVGYPILPLIRQVTEQLPAEASGSMHYGATTQDIMDTGLALQLSAALDRLAELVVELGDALAQRVDEHARTVMAARTHGQQAVPTTFGAKLATFLRQVERLRAQLPAVRTNACRVSLHGAAGTSAGFGPHADAIRREMGERLGLEVGEGPWHVERDGIAAFGDTCARATEVCARLAREIVDLSRTEIGEVAESAGYHRGASSTMPQKANPIDSETIVGMAVAATASSAALHRAMEAGHERSAGEWQIEWHVVPQVAVLTAGCLRIAARVARELRVNAERMAANLELEQGRTLAEAYMFELAPSLGRERAHDVVYEAALISKTRGITLRDALVEGMDGDGAELPALEPAARVGMAADEAARAVQAWRQG